MTVAAANGSPRIQHFWSLSVAKVIPGAILFRGAAHGLLFLGAVTRLALPFAHVRLKAMSASNRDHHENSLSSRIRPPCRTSSGRARCRPVRAVERGYESAIRITDP